MADFDGKCLLHKAIMQGDEFSTTFLIKNGARSSAATHSEHVTPLHLAASYKWEIQLCHLHLILKNKLKLLHNSFDGHTPEDLQTNLKDRN